MKKNETSKQKLPAFFIVILFAITGFTITFLFLNNNYKEYELLPKHVSICLANDSCRSFEVKQVYQLPSAPVTPGIKNINKKGTILFHYNPVFLIWTMLILLLMSVVSGALPVFLGYISEIKNKFLVTGKQVLFIIAFTLIIGGIMILLPLLLRGYYQPSQIVDDFGILIKNNKLVPVLSLVTLILSLPLIITMFMVGTAANSAFGNFSNETEIKAAVKQFSYLNSALLSTLQVLAIIVVLTGFCSAALGQSIKSVFILNDLDIFPKEVSYAYGLFYALFLAMLYIPVYISLKKKGNELKIKILESVPGLEENGAKERKELAENLELKGSALDSLKLALTILSPLIASFIPEYLQIFK